MLDTKTLRSGIFYVFFGEFLFTRVFCFVFCYQSSKFDLYLVTGIEEWHKREVSGYDSFLRNNPSIIKYIAGHRGEGHKDVVKVFVFNDFETTKTEFAKFEESNKGPKNYDFEFVNLNVRSTQQNEEEKILEGNALAFEYSDNIQLTQMIEKQEDKLYARHSNLIGIEIGNVSKVHNLEQEQPGIIFYCLDKSLIPFGEKPLPNSIEGWPCDVREDFFMFGQCAKPCRRIDPNLTELGCSIGIESDPVAGSAGFFYESKTRDNPFESGFLTAAHVAVKQTDILYSSKKQLSQHELGRENHIIVHPSLIDGNDDNNAVGHVVEAFYGNYGNPLRGLDVAVVKNNMKRPEGIAFQSNV